MEKNIKRKKMLQMRAELSSSFIRLVYLHVSKRTWSTVTNKRGPKWREHESHSQKRIENEEEMKWRCMKWKWMMMDVKLWLPGNLIKVGFVRYWAHLAGCEYNCDTPSTGCSHVPCTCNYKWLVVSNFPVLCKVARLDTPFSRSDMQSIKHEWPDKAQLTRSWTDPLQRACWRSPAWAYTRHLSKSPMSLLWSQAPWCSSVLFTVWQNHAKPLTSSSHWKVASMHDFQWCSGLSRKTIMMPAANWCFTTDNPLHKSKNACIHSHMCLTGIRREAKRKPTAKNKQQNYAKL